MKKKNNMQNKQEPLELVNIQELKDRLSNKYRLHQSWFNGVSIDEAENKINIYTSCAIPKSTKAEIIADAPGFEVKFFNTGITETKL